MNAFLREVETLGIKVVSLHTSGHADVGAIDKLIRHTNPKVVEYIHTEINRKSGNWDGK